MIFLPISLRGREKNDITNKFAADTHQSALQRDKKRSSLREKGSIYFTDWPIFLNGKYLCWHWESVQRLPKGFCRWICFFVVAASQYNYVSVIEAVGL